MGNKLVSGELKETFPEHPDVITQDHDHDNHTLFFCPIKIGCSYGNSKRNNSCRESSSSRARAIANTVLRVGLMREVSMRAI